jgi:cyclophilin family peptidyl-prolyl cis-trans isomerase
MARTRIPDSATSQFFINHKTNTFLDHQKNRAGYAVFGKVIRGMDVVDKIATTKTKAVGRLSNLPVETISIIKARVVKPKAVIKLKTEAEKPASPVK